MKAVKKIRFADLSDSPETTLENLRAPHVEIASPTASDRARKGRYSPDTVQFINPPMQTPEALNHMYTAVVESSIKAGKKRMSRKRTLPGQK